MRRVSAISWLLIVVGLVFLAVAVIYLTVTAPNLPSFLPGHVGTVNHARHYTKRGLAALVVAILAFVGAFLFIAKDRPASTPV